VGRAFYKLEGKRGRELKFTVVDCERLKHNFNFWHCQNRGKSYEIFEARYRAVIDHHFGDHSSCQAKDEGGWCKYKGNNNLIAEAQKSKTGTEIRTVMQHCTSWYSPSGSTLVRNSCWDKCTTSSCPRKVNRYTNRSHMCIAPNDKHFSSSMALSDHVALVVITDSVGYEVGVLMIFEELGVELPPVTVQYLVRRNQRREYGKSTINAWI